MIKRNFHLYFNFTKYISETVEQSLCHSCRWELTPQGISLPLDYYSYNRRLLGLIKKAFTFFFTYQHWADITPYTSYYYLARSCVFVKQSLFFFCARQNYSLILRPFLPKLHGQFAEFLRNIYLVRFSIFYLFTCVGLSTM